MICKLCNKDKEFYKRSDRPGFESCCKDCKRLSKKANYEATKTTPVARWAHAKSYAKKRKHEWALGKEEYITLITKKCNYCKTNLTNEVGVGLDRLNNDKGYIAGNVVPCCGACNQGRGDNFTSEEWQVMINALKQFKNGRFASGLATCLENKDTCEKLHDGSTP